MQYVPSGVFFARVRHQGKLFRQSLESDVFTTAKLRLPNKLKVDSIEEGDRRVWAARYATRRKPAWPAFAPPERSSLFHPKGCGIP